ncbi:hypothetical protein D8768_14995 [Enterobacter hormaechei]|nr:hypothetical protein D8768_14995 [Enterobacter hormaechei]
MHFPIWGQTAPPQGGKGINSIKKIVQICALLCNREKRPGRKECRQNRRHKKKRIRRVSFARLASQ